MYKEILFNDDARKRMKDGIDKLTNAVKITLGPRGNNVIIEREGLLPHITKDGVTVAKSIALKDHYENIGVHLIRSAAIKTGEGAGDGTSSSIVLAHALINEGMKNLDQSHNFSLVKKGMLSAVKEVTEFIKTNSIKVDDNWETIENIATISANNDRVTGKLITDAMQKVTKNGVITVEENSVGNTSVKVVEGFQIDSGYLSPYFATNMGTMECELTNPFVFVYDKKINALNDMFQLIQRVHNEGRPLLIIAEDMDSSAVSTLISNKTNMDLKIAVVKAPGFGVNRREILKDICVATGATLISEEAGKPLSTCNYTQLGSAKKIVINKTATIIHGGNGDKNLINARTNLLVSQINNSTDVGQKEKLQERLAKLSGGIAIISIGGNSEMEVKEKHDLIDDALCATRAALEEGILPGGSTVYVKALSVLDKLKEKAETNELMGIEIVRKAILAPIRAICTNAGVSPEVVIHFVSDSNNLHYGYDAYSDEYGNMLEKGIIDPAKVSRLVLENAVAAAILFLSTNCVITNAETSQIEE